MTRSLGSAPVSAPGPSPHGARYRTGGAAILMPSGTPRVAEGSGRGAWFRQLLRCRTARHGVGRNPKSGDQAVVPAKHVPHFSWQAAASGVDQLGTLPDGSRSWHSASGECLAACTT